MLIPWKVDNPTLFGEIIQSNYRGFVVCTACTVVYVYLECDWTIGDDGSYYGGVKL